MRKIKFSFAAVSAATLLAACGGGDDPIVAPVPEETRAQDTRTFTADATATTFDAMAAAAGDAVDMGTTAAGPVCLMARDTA